MRSSLCSVVLLTGLVTGSSFAHADLITLSISQSATGTVGGQSFTNKLLTYSASFTTADLAACLVPDNSCSEGPGQLILDDTDGLMASFTVEGLGTFQGVVNDYIYFGYSGSLEGIVIENGGDVEGRFSLPNPLVGDACEENLPFYLCPVTAYTSGGDLTLTSVGDSYSTSVEINGVSSVPEPSTLMFFASGAVGMFGLLCRRLRSVGQ